MGHGFLRFWDTDSQDTCTCGESAGVNTDFFWIIGHRYTLLPIGVLREGTMSRIGTDFFWVYGAQQEISNFANPFWAGY